MAPGPYSLDTDLVAVISQCIVLDFVTGTYVHICQQLSSSVCEKLFFSNAVHLTSAASLLSYFLVAVLDILILSAYYIRNSALSLLFLV